MAVQFGPELPPKMASLRAEKQRMDEQARQKEHQPDWPQYDVEMKEEPTMDTGINEALHNVTTEMQDDEDIEMDIPESPSASEDQHSPAEHSDTSSASVELEEDRQETIPEALFPGAEVVVLAGAMDRDTLIKIQLKHRLFSLEDNSREAMIEAIRRRSRGSFLVHSSNLSDTVHELSGVVGKVSAFLLGDKDTPTPDEDDDINICLIHLETDVSSKEAVQSIDFALDNRHLNLLEVR